MNAHQSHHVSAKAAHARYLASHDPVFLQLFSAALTGAVRSFKRNPRRSLVVEEGLICQETELAWHFARRARELLDVEEAKVARDLLPPIVSAAELLERFNSALIQTKPQAEETKAP